MLDKDLIFADNERPAVTSTHATNAFNWPFPAIATPKFLDFRQSIDAARSRPMYANFRVTTSFNNQAGNILRFAIFVDDDPTFANVVTTPALVIVRGPDIGSASLVAGLQVTLPVPPLNEFIVAGRRYLTLGMQTIVPTTDWSAGGITAYLTQHPHPQTPPSYLSGF